MRSLLFNTLAALVAVAPAVHAARPTAGSVTPDRLKLPSGPSSVRGLADEPTVDPFLAQIGYQVPIDVPAGYGGLAPSLGLVYSGQLGNGPIGIGWSLAQTEIRRSTRLGVPHYDDSDTLEITGVASGRLIAINASEYRVEGRGQTVRILRVGDGFEVDDGKGNHFKLGTLPASREARDASHTLAWHVDEQTNQMGERIVYSYTNDRGQLYLERVTWGPSAMFGVDLAYEPRPDVTTSYRSGYRVDLANRIASIHVMVGGTERRAYQLAYDTSFSVSRLNAITSTGVSGQGAWPALGFTYATHETPRIEPIQGVGSWRLNAGGTTLVDLDGDGAADLLQLSSGGHSYLTNQNGVFGELQPLPGNVQPISAVQLQDIDGDGRADLIQDTGNGWTVYKFAKTAWVPQTTGSVWPGSQGLALKQPSTTRFADLNGDGLVDAIQWDTDNLKIHLATRTGFDAPYNVGRIGGVVLPTGLGRFQDVNGDGLDDYIVTATDHLDLYVGHGEGTFEAARRLRYPFAGTIASPDDIEIADLDRDGLVDLLKIELGTVKWFPGRADGTFAANPVTLANPETLTAAVVVAVADSNGNGSQDVVWSSTSGMWRMDLAGTTSAGMLTHVTNGLGMDVSFAYASSHALAVADAAAGQPWLSNVPIAMPVPTTKLTDLGPGETQRRIDYRVRNGFWDALEQRFAGFMTTTVTTAGATPAETSSVITTYNASTGANREMRGTVQSQQVRDGTGKRLSATLNTWTTMAVAGLPNTPLLMRPILTESLTQHEEGTTRRTDIKYTYDSLGRVITQTNYGLTDITGDESVSVTTYADDATTWIRDQVCEQKVTDLAGAVVSDLQYYFGDDTAEQPLCTVGNGWPREVRALLQSEGRYITQSSALYDAHGNAITTTKNGVTRTLAYEASGLFPVEERLTAPDRELVWSATWDPVLGAMTSTTDPDGHVTHASYDNLGRVSSVAIDDHPAHEYIDYDWSPPYPTTTTWTFDGAFADLTGKPTTWTKDLHWRQTIDVANGKGQTRYHAQRLGDSDWIISGYHETDANSHVVFAGRPVYATRLEWASRPTGIVGDQLAYDPIGRLISQTLPTGASRTYAYSAFERTTRDSNLAPVHSSLDGQGRPILTERTSSDGAQHEVVTASYDAAGRLTRMNLANGTVERDFAYDTLGRLTQSHDADLGTRLFSYDDSNHLTLEVNAAGQMTRYAYDQLGRLASRDIGGVFRFHYDTARTGGSATNLGGRLAWIEEPTGILETSYDELGRVSFTRHQIDDRVSTTTIARAASGLMLSRTYDDGLQLSYAYDPAGRLVGIADLWQVLDQDASGQTLHERTGNGVDTVYERDVLGLPARVNVRDASGASIYDVTATRDLANQITDIADSDGVGLDHTEHFAYDSFARLTGATAGTGAAQFNFGYAYDVLHNMTSRSQNGPRALTLFAGAYHYGENGHAPRELTSITDATNTVTHTFEYDASGRQIAEDDLRITYDPSDRLVSVGDASLGTVLHAYGASGERVKTTSPDGTVAYYFGDGTADRNGVREHDVTVGGRVVARIAVAPESPHGSGALAAGLAIASGVLAAGMLLSIRRRRFVAARLGAASFATIVLASCTGSTSSRSHALLGNATTTYMHVGFGAGPVLFTDAAGNLIEERRFEPFGTPIDATVRSIFGSPDLITRDLDSHNKRSDATTGWSDHGARWMAPEIARWTSTDPPVEAPDAKFMAAPWALHPYQYVGQNPIAYWDPDGRDEDDVCTVEDTVDTADRYGKTTVEIAAAPAHFNHEIEEVVTEVFGGEAPAMGMIGTALHRVSQAANVASAGFHVYSMVEAQMNLDLNGMNEHAGGATLAIVSLPFPGAGAAIAGLEMIGGKPLEQGVGMVALGASSVENLMQLVIDQNIQATTPQLPDHPEPDTAPDEQYLQDHPLDLGSYPVNPDLTADPQPGEPSPRTGDPTTFTFANPLVLPEGNWGYSGE